MISPGNAGTQEPASAGSSLSGADRKSKLSPEEIDKLLEQSAAGVRYLRKTLRKVFRLPRYPLRLR